MAAKEIAPLKLTWCGLPLARLAGGELDFAERYLLRKHEYDVLQRARIWEAFNEERFRRGQGVAEAGDLLARLVDGFRAGQRRHERP